VDYLVIERQMGQPADALTARLNVIGAGGWWLTENYQTKYQVRRTIFKQVSGVVEYLVTDSPTGRPIQDIEDMLDGYGAQGWELTTLDLIAPTRRRAIFARGGSGGSGGPGFPDAPADGVTYGRQNQNWNPALALNNDVLDGGNF
jgi:hypothetical protein